MAKYDLPATIDYILSTTGQDQLVYIGHSQGTLIAFAAMSSNPEFEKKIKLFIPLAPIVTIGNIMVPYLRALAEITTGLEVSMVMGVIRCCDDGGDNGDDGNSDGDDDNILSLATIMMVVIKLVIMIMVIKELFL